LFLRIGQNAEVNCLYFVAEGTLDVLLWDLLEKKFRDLGEFVEGKEKMKIVVHNTYNSVQELQSMFRTSDDDNFGDEEAKIDTNESTSDGEGLIKLEGDLEQDITQLAQEEMVMLSQLDEDDMAEESTTLGEPGKQIKSGSKQKEAEVICLLDDDDEEEAKDSKPAAERNRDSRDGNGQASTEAPKQNNNGSTYDFSRPFTKYRIYLQTFEGSSFGMSIVDERGRLVVIGNTRGNDKPAVGDILVAVNGIPIAENYGVAKISHYLSSSSLQGPVELTFLEDEDFIRYFRQKAYPQSNMNPTSMPKGAGRNTPAEKGGVIELLDDNDEDDDD
jgi:hypothetical protein